jgi:hypothetical protein
LENTLGDDNETGAAVDPARAKERNGGLWAAVVILPLVVGLAFFFLRPLPTCDDQLRNLDDAALVKAKADLGTVGELGIQVLRGACKKQVLSEFDLTATYDESVHGPIFERYQTCLDVGLGLGTLGKRALDLIR